MASTAPRPTPSDFDGTRDSVVELFIQKWRPSAIATYLNLPQKRVEKILDQEFGKRLGDRQQLIKQAVLEIDWLMRPLMEKYKADAEAGRPSERDFRALLEGNKEMRRLLGLDAAMKVDVSVTSEQSEEEILAELKLQNIDIKMLAPVEDAEFVEKREEVVEGE